MPCHDCNCGRARGCPPTPPKAIAGNFDPVMLFAGTVTVLAVIGLIIMWVFR